MSHLVTTYASALGLKIDKESMLSEFREDFFPTPDRFITVQSSSVNQDAKSYDLWNDVISLVKPALNAAKIDIIHLGAKEDTAISGVIDLRGQTTLKQTNYITSRTILHLGVDSMIQHLVGAKNIPMVVLFASTAVREHGAYWYNKEKTTFLESHRFGGKPSFAAKEGVKTINLIKPEVVAESVLKTLELDTSNLWFSTVYRGPEFNQTVLELIPNVVPSMGYHPELPVTVRMDKLFNETILCQVASTGRKINIVTNKVLAPDTIKYLSQFKSNIISYNHEIDSSCPVSYATFITRFLSSCFFYTKEEDFKKVADLRFKFFDIIPIYEAEDRTVEHFKTDAAQFSNIKVDALPDFSTMWFKTSKYVLSGGKIYPSHIHAINDLPLIGDDGKILASDYIQGDYVKVINDLDFWKDMYHTNVVTLKST
jgi:hypothetical protein